MPFSSNRRAVCALLGALLSFIAPVTTAHAGAGKLRMRNTTAIPVVHYRTAKVDGVDVFYREAGPAARRPCSCCTDSRPRRTCFAT